MPAVGRLWPSDDDQDVGGVDDDDDDQDVGGVDDDDHDQDVGDVDDYDDHAVRDGYDEDNFLLHLLSGETLIAALWR